MGIRTVQISSEFSNELSLVIPPPHSLNSEVVRPGPVRDLTRIFDATRDFPFTSEHLRRFVLCVPLRLSDESLGRPKGKRAIRYDDQRGVFAKGEIDWRTIDVFTRQVEKYLPRVGAFHRACGGISRTRITPRVTAILPQDARASRTSDRSVDAAVTSPPM